MSTSKPEAIADSGRSSENELELGGKTTPVSFGTRVKTYLNTEIDSKATDLISIYACFLTGYTSAHSFTVRWTLWTSGSGADIRRVISGVDFKRVTSPNWV